jgi:hypothetical protein
VIPTLRAEGYETIAAQYGLDTNEGDVETTLRTEDRTVQPDLERFLAKRMNATAYEVESSHVVMLSHPEFVLDVIRDAATAVQGNAARTVRA